MSKQPTPIEVDINQFKDILCAGCGGKYFIAVHSMKFIPRFSFPGLTVDTLKIFPADKCADCGLIRNNTTEPEKPKTDLSL